MKKSRTIDGMNVELRTGRDSELTSSVYVDDVMVGCDAVMMKGCDKLFSELTRDKTGEKARYLKGVVA